MTAADLSNKKVLIVDDAMTVRLYHRDMIEALGCEVDEAENGLEALEKGLSKDYDLLVVDINMPKMDGYRLLKEMRESEQMQAIPVIMISTEAEKQDEELAFQAGANFYMVKPSKKEELQGVVSLLIRE